MINTVPFNDIVKIVILGGFQLGNPLFISMTTRVHPCQSRFFIRFNKHSKVKQV